MRDVVFMLLTIGFFVLAAAYVRACATVVGTAHPEAEAEGRLEDAEAAA